MIFKRLNCYRFGDGHFVNAGKVPPCIHMPSPVATSRTLSGNQTYSVEQASDRAVKLKVLNPFEASDKIVIQATFVKNEIVLVRQDESFFASLKKPGVYILCVNNGRQWALESFNGRPYH